MTRDKNSLEYKRLRQVNNFNEDDETYTYVGFEHPDGEWMIMRIDKTTGMIFTYATSALNDTIPNGEYPTAWTNKETLSYDRTSVAF